MMALCIEMRGAGPLPRPTTRQDMISGSWAGERAGTATERERGQK